MATFQDLPALIKQAVEDGACESAVKWLRTQHSLEDALREAKKSHRLWALKRGYIQFAEYCDWSQFDNLDWLLLLIRQPQLSEYCDWSRFSGYDWSLLLIHQPQFVVHCDYWDKFDSEDWRWLLKYQPQFAKYRDEAQSGKEEK